MTSQSLLLNKTKRVYMPGRADTQQFFWSDLDLLSKLPVFMCGRYHLCVEASCSPSISLSHDGLFFPVTDKVRSNAVKMIETQLPRTGESFETHVLIVICDHICLSGVGILGRTSCLGATGNNTEETFTQKARRYAPDHFAELVDMLDMLEAVLLNRKDRAKVKLPDVQDCGTEPKMSNVIEQTSKYSDRFYSQSRKEDMSKMTKATTGVYVLRESNYPPKRLTISRSDGKCASLLLKRLQPVYTNPLCNKQSLCVSLKSDYVQDADSEHLELKPPDLESSTTESDAYQTNVEPTSIRRREAVSMSVRRWSGALCRLGYDFVLKMRILSAKTSLGCSLRDQLFRFLYLLNLPESTRADKTASLEVTITRMSSCHTCLKIHDTTIMKVSKETFCSSQCSWEEKSMFEQSAMKQSSDGTFVKTTEDKEYRELDIVVCLLADGFISGLLAVGVLVTFGFSTDVKTHLGESVYDGETEVSNTKSAFVYTVSFRDFAKILRSKVWETISSNNDGLDNTKCRELETALNGQSIKTMQQNTYSANTGTSKWTKKSTDLIQTKLANNATNSVQAATDIAYSKRYDAKYTADSQSNDATDISDSQSFDATAIADSQSYETKYVADSHSYEARNIAGSYEANKTADQSYETRDIANNQSCEAVDIADSQSYEGNGDNLKLVVDMQPKYILNGDEKQNIDEDKYVKKVIIQEPAEQLTVKGNSHSVSLSSSTCPIDSDIKSTHTLSNLRMLSNATVTSLNHEGGLGIGKSSVLSTVLQRYYTKGILSHLQKKLAIRENFYGRCLLDSSLKMEPIYKERDQSVSKKISDNDDACDFLRGITWLPLDQLPVPRIETTVAYVNSQVKDIMERLANGETVGAHESMRYEILRVCTYRNYPAEDKPFRIHLATAGLYYASEGDEVVCYCCGLRKSGWKETDRPLEVHRRLTSSCDFLRRNKDVNIAIPELPAENAAKFRALEAIVFASDTAPADQSQQAESASNRHSKFDLERSDDPQFRFFTPPPKHPHYAILSVRLESFNKWPANVPHTPQMMAECGFYYAGFGDCVRCFHCGIGLRHWTEEDHPWIEHARWSKECVYLRNMKGEEFIQNVHLAIEEDEEPEDLIPATPSSTPADISQVTPNGGSNQILLTDPAQSVLEMGYQPRIIKKAIDIILENEGRSGISAQKIMETIFMLEDGDNDLQQSISNMNLSEGASASPSASSQSCSNIGLPEATERKEQNYAPASESVTSQSEKTLIGQAQKNAASGQTHGSARETSGDCMEIQPFKQNSNSTKSEEKVSFEQNETAASRSPHSSLNERKQGVPSGKSKRRDTTKIKDENRKLKEQTICKVCLDKPVAIVFLPCGHLVTCAECAPAMKKCPICRSLVKGTVKAFMS